MANFSSSPGVKLNEIDNSFITPTPVSAGAAIIGPTVKGPVEIPTVVTSYSDFKNKFGGSLTSGSDSYSYLTSISAYNYFTEGGDSLLVTRVTSGSFTPATSSIILNNQNITGGVQATGSLTIAGTFGRTVDDEFQITVGSTEFRFIAADPVGGLPVDNNPLFFLSTGSSTATYLDNLVAKIDAVNIGVNATDATTAIQLTASAAGIAGNSITVDTGSGTTFSDVLTLFGGVNGVGTSNAFTLETLSEGIIMNSDGTHNSDGTLVNGTKDNIRWEITGTNTDKGTFNVVVRQGNDKRDDKIILETFNGVSLDPNSSNYISKTIGDQVLAYDSSTNQIDITSGDFPNFSRLVRVKSVDSPTLDYFDNSGNAKTAFTSSLPVSGKSGSFGTAIGDNNPSIGGANFYKDINTQTQGLIGTDYDNMINLLGNVNNYQFNVLSTPGLTNDNHTSQISSIINNTIERGDNIFVMDTVDYAATLANALTQAATRNTSYASTYWPWLRVQDPETGKLVFVPASTMIPGVYAFNDRIANTWNAPAGISRGGLSTVLQAKLKLTEANKASLYDGNINPIATFPKKGVVVFGQKTLQKGASALDRINVRRLLIDLKSFIGQIADTLVFENNTITTRNKFLSEVTPFLEVIQQKGGLYAFKVIMDDTNNTDDVIDRNQLVGNIYIQPTKTAEFISLDFIVLPTGAEFPA